jgi:glycosyltransferase involved in cell wall biosynthesis
VLARNRLRSLLARDGCLMQLASTLESKMPKESGRALAGNGRRILHAIATMEGGGAERQLAYLSGGLVRLGWEVHIACIRGGPNQERLEESGAIVHRLSHTSTHDPFLSLRLAALGAKIRPTLVQSWLLLMDTHVGIYSRLTGIPWILSERNSAAAYKPSWKNRLRQCLGRGASAIIANSTAGLEYWTPGVGGSGPRLFVVRNTVPVDQIESQMPVSASQFALENARPVILYAGRLIDQKNIPNLLTAFKIVMSQTEAVVAICGDGPLHQFVREELKAPLMAKRAVVAGYVTNLCQWMKRADVFVSVSCFEGCPNTVLECMASGCPLVVSDIPAHREILDEATAILVDPNSPCAIAEGILSVLRNREDAVSRANSALSTVRHWSQDSIAREYDRIYAAILDHQSE